MPCDIVGNTIICSRGERKRCGIDLCQRTADRLCDFLVEPVAFGRKPKTCDRPMCRQHAVEVGFQKDYCPLHVRAAATAR